MKRFLLLAIASVLVMTAMITSSARAIDPRDFGCGNTCSNICYGNYESCLGWCDRNDGKPDGIADHDCLEGCWSGYSWCVDQCCWNQQIPA